MGKIRFSVERPHGNNEQLKSYKQMWDLISPARVLFLLAVVIFNKEKKHTI